MCKIKIIRSGECKKTICKCFTPPLLPLPPPPCPLPSLPVPIPVLPPAPPPHLPPPAPPAPPAPVPPPPVSPNTAVKIAPEQVTTKKGKDALKKATPDKDIQKIVVYPPKTIAHVPKIIAHIPKKIVHVPKTIASAPNTSTSTPNTSASTSKATDNTPSTTASPSKTSASPPKTTGQGKDPKNIDTKQEGLENPLENEIVTGKNVVHENSKQEKPIVATSAGDGKADSRRGNANRKTEEAGIKRSKEKNRRPKPGNVKASPAKVQPGEGESQTTPNTLRRPNVQSPPRNVRFAIGESRRTLSTTSSSSTSSDASFIDLHPHQTLNNRDSTQKQARPSPTSRNMVQSFLDNMEESDFTGSEISSNIDPGDYLESTMPWKETITSREARSARSQLQNKHRDSSIHDRKPASSASDVVYHDLMTTSGGEPTEFPYRFLADPEWDSMSDQESAIDCSGSSPRLTPDQGMNSWDGWQNSQQISGFSAWLKSLSKSPQARKSSRSASPAHDVGKPILVYKTKGTRFGEKEQGPLLAIRKGPPSRGSNHAYSDERLQDNVEELDEPVIRHATNNPSARPASVAEEADEAVNYDPGLQIFWRDV